jgi:hypothetical protein
LHGRRVPFGVWTYEVRRTTYRSNTTRASAIEEAANFSQEAGKQKADGLKKRTSLLTWIGPQLLSHKQVLSFLSFLEDAEFNNGYQFNNGPPSLLTTYSTVQYQSTTVHSPQSTVHSPQSTVNTNVFQGPAMELGRAWARSCYPHSTTDHQRQIFPSIAALDAVSRGVQWPLRSTKSFIRLSSIHNCTVGAAITSWAGTLSTDYKNSNAPSS